MNKIEVKGFPRHIGPEPGHLSECLIVSMMDDETIYEDDSWVYCTCDDWSPE